ncbi:hypothetical protein Ddye_009487 [Dipteronia dyeriana]|uniref:DUF1985 domain-containing protein n=1 Tax=Dipteronia dyeriana TaxID=168575 RepID=A0AAD9XBR3_9ROSI|nr:hypothetical protein Ddye_009487 [Dipteronia dyeriana]
MRNMWNDFLKTPEGDWYKGKLTRHDRFKVLALIDDALNWVPKDFTVEDRQRSMASCFGRFMSMYRGMIFSDGVIHRLLLRELDHNGPTYGMWFLLMNHLVRFSKVKFYLITELRFGVIPDTSLYASMGNEIHQRYFLGANEVSFEELRVVLTLGEFQEAYDAVKLCLIYMLNWILMRVDEGFKIPVWQFQLVEDLAAFDAYAHVYRHSMWSFKHVLPRRHEEIRQQSQGADVHTVEEYNIYGLSHVLLIFTFEVIPDLGLQFGARRVTELSPHMLKWELTKQLRGKKLHKIFSAWILATTEIVPTTAEMEAPYFTGLSKGEGEPVCRGGQSSLSDFGP